MSGASHHQASRRGGARARLDSWKEIAAYLKRGVRTVRRWEHQEGLPVRRHIHGKRGTVYAFAQDIDSWLHGRSVSKGAKQGPELLERLTTTRAHHRRRNRPLLIAILPLRSLSDPQQERFADGLTQELILEAGHCCPDRLRVIALTSVMQYKNSSKSIRQIGRELGVDYILEGFIRRYGLRLRLSARLIAARDQAHIWAESYEIQLRPILSFQQALARKVADSLAAQLHAKPTKGTAQRRRTLPNLAAHNAYLEGNSHFRPMDGEIKKSIEDLNLAIERDPKFAPSYAQLALTYFRRLFMNYPPIVTLTRIQNLGSKALKLDPKLARAHAMLAAFELFGAGSWTDAETHIRQAIKLNPSDAWAWVIQVCYRIVLQELPEAMEDLRRARGLNPKCPEQGIWFATLAYLARDYDFGVECCRVVLELDPLMLPAHTVLGLCYAQTGDRALALSECEKVRQSGDGNIAEAAQLCSIYALAGRPETAESLLQDLVTAREAQYVRYIFLAQAAACLRDNEQTIEWLQKAYEQRDPLMVFLKSDPRFDGLAEVAGFRSIVRRVGLPSHSEVRKIVPLDGGAAVRASHRDFGRLHQ